MRPDYGTNTPRDADLAERARTEPDPPDSNDWAGEGGSGELSPEWEAALVGAAEECRRMEEERCRS